MHHAIWALIHLFLESWATHRDAQIRFLKVENRILRSRVKAQRIIVTPQERSQLLRIGQELNHQVQHVLSVVQYRTYQRWLLEQKQGKQPSRVGRPRVIGQDLRDLIVRIAKENTDWGYLRIAGELLKLRRRVSKSSVQRILNDEGVYPTPPRWRLDRADFQPWDAFLKLHMNTLVACDFFVKNIHSPFGKSALFQKKKISLYVPYYVIVNTR